MCASCLCVGFRVCSCGYVGVRMFRCVLCVFACVQCVCLCVYAFVYVCVQCVLCVYA